MRARASSLLLATLVLPCAARAQGPVIELDPIVVTATGRPERRSEIAGTVQVIDEATIRRSTAQSLTELFAEQGVGFFSEWSPSQTSINIRGGATDGQGRDFRSQVLVLVNGRRAGTANLSQLSPADVERVEIVRGPASVVYGSQAIGGVINLILRNGRTSPGGFVEAAGGSWGLAEGRARYGAQFGAYDTYLGLSGGRRDSYSAPNGYQPNTAWQRAGVTAALGGQLGPAGHLGVTLRTDGIYDAGFRGSSWSLFNQDDRRNHSLDVVLNGATPDGRIAWNLQGYAVRDQNDFRWASPVVRSGLLPAPGTASDVNIRTLDVTGIRLQPVVRLWAGSDLLVGLDAERSWLRSTRVRVNLPGGGTGQVSPQDNDQTDTNVGLYAELSQRLLDDRLILRGGIRQTWGVTGFDPTPNLPLQRNRDAGYDATTYSAGFSYRVVDGLTARFNASSGFRAPTATELAADFTALGGGRIFGNPNVRPESNDQVEVGAQLLRPGFRLDLALFQNVIHDRLTTRLRSGVANTSDYINNPGDVVVRGVELQADFDLARPLGWSEWRLRAYANASWNFDMQDRGAAATANRHVVERMYRYQAGLGVLLGQERWDVTAQTILRGPMYYNTEESLLVPQAEPNREFIHRKSAYAVVNLRATYEIRPGVRLFGAVNNLFDKNYHAIFIATESQPYLSDARFSNGGRGNSAPGREFIAGLRFTF